MARTTSVQELFIPAPEETCRSRHNSGSRNRIPQTRKPTAAARRRAALKRKAILARRAKIAKAFGLSDNEVTASLLCGEHIYKAGQAPQRARSFTNLGKQALAEGLDLLDISVEEFPCDEFYDWGYEFDDSASHFTSSNDEGPEELDELDDCDEPDHFGDSWFRLELGIGLHHYSFPTPSARPHGTLPKQFSCPDDGPRRAPHAPETVEDDCWIPYVPDDQLADVYSWGYRRFAAPTP